MSNNNYRVIDTDPNSEPVLTISQIEHAGQSYVKYEITGWGGSAVPVEGGEDFSKSLGSSIKYVKTFSEKGGDLG
jgi:hypothetical protein